MIDTALRRLAELEQALADLYSWYSDVLVSDAEAVYVFARMARDEAGHARLVDYQRRIILKGPALEVDVDLDTGAIQALREDVRKLREAPQAPTVDEAVRQALRLEMAAVEALYRKALKDVSPEIARLVEALDREDSLHVERLVAMARHRGIPIPPEAATGRPVAPGNPRPATS